MKINILLFAAARDAVGRDSVSVEIAAGSTMSLLREQVLLAAPELKSMSQSLLWAVNNEYASDHRVVQESDAVACFPPVSGG